MKIHNFQSIAKLYFSILLICILLLKADAQEIEPEKVPENRKSIHIHAFLGPFGKAYIPTEMIDNKSFPLDANGNTQSDFYIFPSLYFLISAKPNVHISKKNGQNGGFIDYEFSKVGQDLEWMRVSYKLEPIYCSGVNEQSIKSFDAQPLKVLALLPESTDEIVEDSKIARAVGIGEQLVTKLAPFIPTVSTQANAAAGATSILFKNLFPPRAVAYSYAFVDSYDKLGWYWKRKDIKEKPESIVGLRRGIVMLQIRRGIKGIRIHYRVDAKWSSDYSDVVDDEYADKDVVSTDIMFGDKTCEVPKAPNFYERIDYEFLKNLDDFPMVVPKEIVCKLYQKEITTTECNNWDIKNSYPFVNLIRSNNGKDYLLREDVKKMLLLK